MDKILGGRFFFLQPLHPVVSDDKPVVTHTDAFLHVMSCFLSIPLLDVFFTLLSLSTLFWYSNYMYVTILGDVPWVSEAVFIFLPLI